MDAHAFKRGALTNIWVANEKGLVNSTPRLLKTIGDHALDYHESYVRVPLELIAEKFADTKKALIGDFLDNKIPARQKRILQFKFRQINVRQAASSVL